LFPFYKSFKKKFPISKDTIFVFKDTIYADNKLPYDVMAHEFKHIDQQRRMGSKKWIRLYLKDKNFRFKQELEAYQFQMETVKDTGHKEDYENILKECAENISSELYGGLISYEEAIKLLE